MSNPKLIFDLSKATIDKSKLVAKQVQVTRGGKTFTQTVWVNPNQNNPAQPTSKTFDFNEFDKLKSDKVKALQYLKDCGITWQEHSHAGVNWMRACVAAKQAAGISNTNNKAGAPVGNTNAAGTHNVKQLDYWKLAADGYDNLDAKKKVASIKKQTDKDEFVALASKVVSWNPHSNPSINLMRASMALSSWCETHSMDDLSIALGSQATGIQSSQVKQPDKPVDPPKPKEELEVQSNHTERQKNLIKLINSISDEKDLENFASAGMVPEDDTAKSFIVDRLLSEYNKHIRPAISGTGGYRVGYHSQRELRKEFTKMTTKLYRGVHEKIVDNAVGGIVDTEMLYDFVDPRNGARIGTHTKRNYGKNTNMSDMIASLQNFFGGYADYDDVSGDTSTSLQTGWDMEESKKKYSSEKDGFVMSLKRVGEFDPSLKSQTEEMIKTYESMMELVGYNSKAFNLICNFPYGKITQDLERETTTFYKKKLLIATLRNHGLSDDDIAVTLSNNDFSSYDKAESWPVYRKKDPNDGNYRSNSEPVLDDNGNEVTIDLTTVVRPDTGEVLWNPGTSILGWNSGLRSHELRKMIQDKEDFDKPPHVVTSLQHITSDVYDKFVELQRKLYGVQLQDSNSQAIVDTEPHTWSEQDVWSFRAIKDGDNEELDAVITNLSFIINASRINYSIADQMWQSRNSAANKNGEDYSGNFTYHGYNFGRARTKGNRPQNVSSDQKRELLKQQLEDIPLFTKNELTTLRDYVNNNGDPTINASSYYYYTASETLSRIKSLSPERQGWQGIKGTPIDDIFTRYIEASIQYCPQVYNTRVKDKKDMKNWLYKQTGFTPYQPAQANVQQATASGTKLYDLRKKLFDKVHCSIRTANHQEYTDITHKVKMDFDYVDPQTGKRVPKADRAYDNRALALHGNVYIINNSEAQDNFQKEAARMNETPVQMYHGTSYGGGCGIVGVDGRFRISGKETSGLQTSGSMLGQGIYMAKLVGKTLPYLGNSKYSYSSYNINNQPGATQGYQADGCLLVCDAVLGKHYHSDISTSDASRHNDGTYDSVSVGAGAQMGGGTLKEYECIVRRNNQISPKYIVDCGGRVR